MFQSRKSVTLLLCRRLFTPKHLSVHNILKKSILPIKPINLTNLSPTINPGVLIKPRKMSSQPPKKVTFEEMVQFINDKSRTVVDVREPNELKETGVIPGSVNIPLGEVEKALTKLSPAEFKKKYGFDKPNKTSPLVFSCKMGGRAEKARTVAEKAGYTDTLTYGGSWTEWAEKYKP